MPARLEKNNLELNKLTLIGKKGLNLQPFFVNQKIAFPPVFYMFHSWK